MTLKKEIQLRDRKVSLSIFKTETNGRVLVSFGKEYERKCIKGPLFSEEEMYDLVQLVREYDEWESKGITGKANRRLVQTQPVTETISLADVEAAIESIKAVPSNTIKYVRSAPIKSRTIKVIPSMPKYKCLPNAIDAIT